MGLGRLFDCELDGGLSRARWDPGKSPTPRPPNICSIVRSTIRERVILRIVGITLTQNHAQTPCLWAVYDKP